MNGPGAVGHGALRGRLRSLRRGLLTWPDGVGWRGVATELAWGLPAIGALAWAGGLVAVDPTDDPRAAIATLAILFFAPALGKELLFRGALLDPARPSTARLCLPVALFVLWHPLQAVTFGPPWAGSFLDPWFLSVVAVMGVMLCRVYVRTGSLWPCVFAHWLIVAAWKLLLGGPF